jgi:hypothetical protein
MCRRRDSSVQPSGGRLGDEGMLVRAAVDHR